MGRMYHNFVATSTHIVHRGLKSGEYPLVSLVGRTLHDANRDKTSETTAPRGFRGLGPRSQHDEWSRLALGEQTSPNHSWAERCTMRTAG